MPKATVAGATYARAGVFVPVNPSLMPTVMESIATGDPSQIGPPENTQPDALDHQMAEEDEEETSAGTSSSTSDDRPDKSGEPSGTDPQSPAPDAESPSEAPQQEKVEASSASTTGGSTQETGSGQASLQVSSEDKTPQTEQVPADAQAERKAFSEKNPQQADS